MKATFTHATSRKLPLNSLETKIKGTSNQQSTKQSPVVKSFLKRVNDYIGRFPKDEQAEALQSLLILLLKNN